MSNPWGLTPRQLEAARLAPFCSHDEIGRELGVTGRTARYLTGEIRRKMGVARKRDIGVELYKAGLLLRDENGLALPD